VYKQYDCCNSNSLTAQLHPPRIPTSESVPDLLVTESVSIVSEDFGQALHELWSRAGRDIPHPNFSGLRPEEFKAPYYWWYWHQDEFGTAIPNLESHLIPYVHIFGQYIDESFRAEYDQVDKLLEDGKVTAKYMPYLYVFPTAPFFLCYDLLR
jgi:hypothetical protein